MVLERARLPSIFIHAQTTFLAFPTLSNTTLQSEFTPPHISLSFFVLIQNSLSCLFFHIFLFYFLSSIQPNYIFKSKLLFTFQ